MTAIFLVLVIFALVVAIVSMVNQNISFTKYSHMKTRAHYLAKGAANLALKAMVEDPDSLWDVKYAKDKPPYEVIDDRDKMQAWTTVSAASSDLLFLHGRGIVNYASPGRIIQDYVVVVKKAPTLPVAYARKNAWGPDAIYRSEGGGQWEHIEEVPPRIYWNNSFVKKDMTNDVDMTKSGSVYKMACNLRSMCADNKGNLYGIWIRSGPDTLYRYNKNDGWTAIKPPMKVMYNNKGEKTEKPANPVPWLTDLTTDGENYLYARFSKGGPDTIYRLDLKDCDPENPTWKVLPPAPCRYYVNAPDAPLKEPDGYASNLQSLCADKSGNLYARYNRYGIDTIYRFPNGGRPSSEVSDTTWKPDDWQWLPAVPRVYYKLEGGQYVEYDQQYNDAQGGGPKYAGNLQNLSVTSDGTVYGRFYHNGVDTLYRLPVGSKSPEDITKMTTSDWQTVKPGAVSFYVSNYSDETEGEDEDDTEEDTQEPDDLTLEQKKANAHFRETDMDSDNTLYMRFPISYHPDSIMTFADKSFKPSGEQKYNLMKPVTAYRFKFLHDPTYPLDKTKKKFQWVPLERKVDGKIVKCREVLLNEVAAGGVTSSTGKSVYVVVSNL